MLEPDVESVFAAFCDGSLNLDRLNQAHLVLLPKKDGARTPDAFRPISLQGCVVKAFTKAMVHRLQPLIEDLVSPDQSGFIKGCNIADNYIYAVELLSCFHARRCCAAILKLDFRKAFDSVAWDSLDSIMRVRGFDDNWRRWTSSILRIGKTAILLNNVPGNWFSCARGLRKGDPLSPYLFIIVADLLQRMIEDACASYTLHHPAGVAGCCPVLQYADDTLIMVRGCLAEVSALKDILDAFAAATGLLLSYHKTTFIPMNMAPDEAAAMASTLGCPTASFPQSYLGLPISPSRLHVSDFAPLLAKSDKYFAG